MYVSISCESAEPAQLGGPQNDNVFNLGFLFVSEPPLVQTETP